jgi:hypothetical protein
MNFIGIDFSLNSPGIVVLNNELNFISYLKQGTGTKTDRLLQSHIGNLPNVDLQYQPIYDISKDFSLQELNKLNRFISMSDAIIRMIKEKVDDTKCIFAFEGVSYGSNGGTNNLIDMAAAAAIFKYKILEEFGDMCHNIVTVAPSTIKKHAGKGNMGKRDLWDVFVENRLDDKKLGNLEFFDYVKTLEINKSVPKPLDDLVDAYFLVMYLSSLDAL